MIETMRLKEIKMHKHVVIGYEHYNPLGVIRSLGEAGINPDAIFLKNSGTRYASRSKYISKCYFVNDYEEALELLLKNYILENKTFIYPCDDNITELLDLNYDKLVHDFYFTNGGENGRIAKYQNKMVSSELSEKCGIKTPKIWTIESGILPEVEFPVITKPLTSYPGWKDDYYVCENKEELLEAYQKIKDKPVIIQTYIKKKNEYSVDGIVWNSGKNVFISVSTLYTYILPDYYSLEMIHSTFKDRDIQNFLNKMFAEIRYEGIFSIDVLIDENDEKWFLEINYRNSAWSYASTKLGMNLPLLWAEAMLFGSIDENARKIVPDNYTALAEVMDLKYRVLKHHYISVFKWFVGVLRADCLYVWSWNDLKPGICKWLGVLGKAISRFFDKFWKH